MTYRLRNLVLAVALATLAAALITFYVSNYKKNVQHGEDNVTVFVANRDISAGTSGTDAARTLKSVEVARRNVVPGAISSPEQVKTLVATDAIYAGEQVSARRFRPVQESGIRAKLKANVRAIQIAGDPNQVLAGTLKAGDHVDVLGNFKFKIGKEDDTRSATRVVLRDIVVLRPAGSAGSGAKLTNLDQASVQLALTDAQSQKLFFAMKNGDWHLDIRAVVNATDSPQSLETLDTILCDGMRKDKFGSICFGRGLR